MYFHFSNIIYCCPAIIGSLTPFLHFEAEFSALVSQTFKARQMLFIRLCDHQLIYTLHHLDNFIRIFFEKKKKRKYCLLLLFITKLLHNHIQGH